jgi:prephenate dehydratase
VKVGYLGPAGTYAEEALLRLVGPEPEQTLVPFRTVIDCFEAVRSGAVPEALVPIENSIEGSVNQTLDQLAAAEGSVAILAQIVQPVRHHLAARRNIPLWEITRVLSHPHAIPQCTTFLRANVPDAEMVAASSTADAVRIVGESDEPWAAIGTLRAADIYGCTVLAADIEDARDNATRFVLVGREPRQAVGPGGFVTSIICVPPRDRPGVLLAILQEFAMRAVNLNKLESRPTKTGLGRYVFFIDMDGSRERDMAVDAALRAIEDQGIAHVVFLGSYPSSVASG